MGYDRGDSFPLDFEPNGILFGSKLKGKPSPRSYPIKFERKWKSSFLSVHVFFMWLIMTGESVISITNEKVARLGPIPHFPLSLHNNSTRV